MPLYKDKDKQDLQIKIFTDEQIQLLTEDDIKSLSIEQIQVFNEKIEVLDKEVEKRTIILSDYIDVITDATSKITSLLEETAFLEKQKIDNFKNFIITMFSFGYINKNKIIEKKINKNKKEIQEKTNERTDLKIIFENISLERKKINDELNNLIKLTKLWKNINDKKNSIKNTSPAKEAFPEQYFELLGLSIGATIPEINASFRRLSLKLHPDKNTNNPETTINFQKLSEARNVLVKQKEYEEKTNKVWKENLKKQQPEQETFQSKQKEEILAKQKFKIFKKEIDQKIKKYYIELLPKILYSKIELKKLEKELLTLQSKSSKLIKSIINLNIMKINPRINFYIKCITLDFYDWNKITEKELCENKNEFIKTNREKENLKEKYGIVKTNMQILINEQNLLQEDLKELFAKEDDLKKYINSFNLEEKDSIRDSNKHFSSSV